MADPRGDAGEQPAEPDPFWWRDEVPRRPLPVEGGIQIARTRGPVARTWWSRRFIGVLEELGVGGRLSRGRSYARAGQIVSLEVGPGGAGAEVQGSRPRPYRARIGIPTFGKAEWAAVTDALAGEASYAAMLLAGEMPHAIEEVFAGVGLSLFPDSASDIVMDCTCPDHAVPCKHLAAVFYVLAEQFDADPFRILALRGRDRDALLDDLRERRSTAAREAGSAAADGAAPLVELLDRFYTGGVRSARLVGSRTPPDALLDQLPDFMITVRGEQVKELLRSAYRALDGRD
ncbi:SWIM zinc finger family protein [Pseudonocardia humida]|uniref:SWIM zinc finger family protein n=1 Tax=Pseudonocardia humida TaxID=2800819 RepID=A0ABT0ZRZ6_9PSEU|nr:SWIM zinc finger family protein [Pseudonocardia humida]MCO1653497.1 SWIM zinc finger family protein [Pseudonocardia humida]